MLELGLIAVALIVSYSGVDLYRRWSEQKRILALPNHRSSHTRATPSGGGLVVAVVCLGGYLSAAYLAGVTVSRGYVAGSLVIVGISWLDDVRTVSPSVRFLCHTLAAVLLVIDFGAIRYIAVPGMTEDWMIGRLAPLISIIWIVWLINAYNFMDGIDGLAALQAVIAGAGWWIATFSFTAPGIHLFAPVVAAAALGFLVHNWQPARIFMGDAGSAFLGFTFAALPILAAWENPDRAGIFVVVAVVVVWFFIFDSVLTFSIRLFNGRKVWTAHREHLYQRLVIAGGTHAGVTLLYGAFTAAVGAALAAGFFFGGFAAAAGYLFTAALSVGLAGYALRKTKSQ